VTIKRGVPHNIVHFLFGSLLVGLVGCGAPPVAPPVKTVAVWTDVNKGPDGKSIRRDSDLMRDMPACRIVANNAAAPYRAMGLATLNPALLGPMRQAFDTTYMDCMASRDWKFDHME
jgi:hypothetical protein